MNSRTNAAVAEPVPPAAEAAPTPAASPAAPYLRPGADRLAGLLAFALAAEKGEPASPESVEARAREAERLLTEHAYKLLHNRVGDIQREAVAEHLAALRPPLGFWGVAAACLLSLAAFGAAALWLVANPGALGALVSLLGG